MKVAVVNCTGGGISGGYKSYLVNILPLLSADSRVESLLCISPSSLHMPDWLPGNVKIQFSDCPPFKPFNYKFNQILSQTLSAFGPDVIFVPIARTVHFRDVPVITMIQNMAPLVSWKWYGLLEKPRLAAQWFETLRAVKQADKVIAISSFVQKFLVKSWGMTPEKIVPIYFGSPVFGVPAVRPAQIPLEWNDFVFTAGSLEPYRSIEDVIKCAEYFKNNLGQPLKIVIAGSARKNMQSYAQTLKRLAEKIGVSHDLCWTGQLTKEEMNWCYKKCSSFVMTSRVEAAPNIVLEAMSCGAPCVAADNEPLPEFFAETALYYKPGDIKMLADRIKEISSWDAEKKKNASVASYARSHKFTWEKAAMQTVDLFALVSKSQ